MQHGVLQRCGDTILFRSISADLGTIFVGQRRDSNPASWKYMRLESKANCSICDDVAFGLQPVCMCKVR